ncbi:MAG: hypothetical protein NT027_17010 [Proteobacteria bacterium]|nr:hypothetical protein [Pseudomonadota bacterium]
MTLPSHLKEALERLDTVESTRTYSTHNLELFYKVHTSRIIANKCALRFDMKDNYWRSPEALLIVGYAEQYFQNKFAPVTELRQTLLELAMQLSKSRSKGKFRPTDRSLWRKTEAGYIASLMNQIATESSSYKFSAAAKSVMETHKELKDSKSFAQHFSEFVLSIAKKDTCEEDLQTGLIKRVCFLPYILAGSHEELVKNTQYFAAWYTLFTSTNAYENGGAQSWGPFLGNNSCSDLLDIANQWSQGKSIKEFPMVGFGSQGDEKTDVSKQMPVQELYGFCSLNRRPYLNKKSVAQYADVINFDKEKDKYQDQLADAVGQQVRAHLSSDASLRQKFSAIWRDAKFGLRDNVIPSLDHLEDCRPKGLAPYFKDSDRLWHLTKDEYHKTFDKLDLGFTELDSACAMAYILLDGLFYTKGLAKESNVIDIKSSQEESSKEDSDSTEENIWLVGTGVGSELWSEFQSEGIIRV